MEIKKELTYLDYLNIFFIGSGGRASGDFIQPGFSVVNTTGWNEYQQMEGTGQISLSFIWSSVKDNISTGNGLIKVLIGNDIVYGQMISQGSISIDVTEYLNLGQNIIKVTISDSYQHNKTETFLINILQRNSFTISYYNGNTLITTQTVVQGQSGNYTGETPTKEQDAQYTYTFAGWSESNDNTVDADVLTNITADKNVYACFTETVRTYTVTWKNGDTILEVDSNVPYGTIPSYNSATPIKTQTAQYIYTFAGWSKMDDNTVDADALAAITADRNVYTCFTQTLRKYTVTFVRASADGGGTLQTISNVDYGTVITAASAYTGATPTTTQGDATDYPFEGWNPASATVQGDTVFTAKFGSSIEVAEITDSWDTIIANIDNGTYSTVYKVGNYKPLDLGTEGTINMQIVAMDADELADGSGYAPLTFVAIELLATKHAFNIVSSVEGYTTSGIKSYVENDIFSLLPSNVKSRLQNVKKVAYTTEYDVGSVLYNAKVWIPSDEELNNFTKHTLGIRYDKIYTDNNSRKKKHVGGSYRAPWFSSSTLSNQSQGVYAVFASGAINTGSYGSNEYGVCLGFCLGLEPETITDSWETILANQNYATDYAIGDTKYLDLGTEGKQLMEIVGIDVDDRADGTGKAGLTWISKTVLNT